MATAYKKAGVQGTAGTGTYATLYNTGASTTAVVSTISVCNTSASPVTYRIGFDSGTPGTPTASEWLVYDGTVAANDTVFITAGITLGNSEYIRVSSSAVDVSFQAFISEIS